MPARSKQQLTAMRIAKAVKEGKTKAKPGTPSAKMAQGMSMKSLNDFTATPTKGLPKIKKGRK